MGGGGAHDDVGGHTALLHQQEQQQEGKVRFSIILLIESLDVEYLIISVSQLIIFSQDGALGLVPDQEMLLWDQSQT